MSVRGRAKAWVLRSRVGVWGADAALIAHTTRLGRSRALSSRLHRLTVFDPAGPEIRQHSVTALVDLFFTLVDEVGASRFVEAGAKEASASRRASKMAGVDEVVAFEANPFTHRRFAAKLERSAVDYNHIAVSDRSGSVTLHVRLRPDGTPRSDGQSSMLVRSDYTPGYKPLAVRAVTLDDWFSAPTGRRTAIWIDVEGATSAVVGGATKLLDETDVLIVEVEERAIWEDQAWLRGDVVEALAPHGLVPLARDRQSRFQFNLLFIRESLRGDVAVREAVDAWRKQIRGAR